MTGVHFLGIGGVGMAGVAFLLKARGRTVSGCDLYSTPRTRWLEENGIPVAIGHDAAHIDSSIGELIVTPAVPPDNPELAAARAAGISVRSRGEVLASLVNAADGIAVCGTHGKTTTATFTTRLLQSLGAHPSWCIGGETGSVPVAGVGTNPTLWTDPLVVEADESDGTLALYHPHTLVLNAVDFDHLEHFNSKEDYFDCYRAVIRQTSDTIIVCADHPQALDLVQEAVCSAAVAGRPPYHVSEHENGNLSPKIVTFGFAPEAQVNAADWPDIPVLGRHNIANALAAIAVALSRGFTREQIAAAAGLAPRPEERMGRERRPSTGREGAGRHLFLDARYEVDNVARAEKHEDVAGSGGEEEMVPSLVKRPRQDDLWCLFPEGGVEVSDVAAEKGFLESGVDGGEHHLVRRFESGWKFIAEGLRARVAVGLEQDAETGGVEGSRHVDGAFQFRRVVGVVGVHAYAIRFGDPFETPVGKGGDGVGKGCGNLLAREAT